MTGRLGLRRGSLWDWTHVQPRCWTLLPCPFCTRAHWISTGEEAASPPRVSSCPPDCWELPHRYSNIITLCFSERSAHTSSSDFLVIDLPNLFFSHLPFCWLLSTNWCLFHSSRHLSVQTMWKISMQLEILPTSRVTPHCYPSGSPLTGAVMLQLSTSGRCQWFLTESSTNPDWGFSSYVGWSPGTFYEDVAVDWGRGDIAADIGDMGVWVTCPCNLHLLEQIGSNFLYSISTWHWLPTVHAKPNKQLRASFCWSHGHLMSPS